MRKRLALRHTGIVQREGNGFRVEFPDFPEVTVKGTAGRDDPEIEAAAPLAGVILDRLMRREDLPFPSALPTTREEGEMVVGPRIRDRPDTGESPPPP